MALAIAVVLVLAAGLIHLTGINTELFLRLNGARLFSDTALSMFSVGGLGLAMAIVASAFTAGGQQRLMAAFLWCLPIAGLLVHAIKRIAAVPRPPSLLGGPAIHVVGPVLHQGSMPSGHSATAFAMWVLLACVVWSQEPGRRPSRRSVFLIAVTGLVACAMGLSRIGVGAHWPSDVLVGAALGMVSGWLALRCENRWSLADWLEGPRGRRCLGLAQIGAGITMVALPTGYPLAQPLQWLIGAIGVGAGLVNLMPSVLAPAVLRRLRAA